MTLSRVSIAGVSRPALNRKESYIASCYEAVFRLDVKKIVAMADAVDWRWRGNLITEDMVEELRADFLKYLVGRADNKSYNGVGMYTGGFWWGCDEDETGVVVYVCWGESEQSDHDYATPPEGTA